MARHVFFTAVIFLLSLIMLSTTLTRIDPFGTQKIAAYFSFFICMFFLIASFFTCFIFFTEELFSKKNLGHQDYSNSMRRGTLIAFFIISLIAMQLFSIIGIFEVTLFVVFLILMEMSFLKNKH